MVTSFLTGSKKKKVNPLTQSTQIPEISKKPSNKDLLKPTEVKFNEDKTVDYTVGGKTTKLSKEEYRRVGEQSIKGVSEKGGEITPNIKNVQADIEKKREVMAIDEQLRNEARKNAIIGDLLAEDISAEQKAKIQLPDISQLQQDVTRQQMEKKGEGFLPGISQKLPFGRQKGLGEFVGDIKSSVAGVADFIRVGFTGKKPLKVQQAEATFNDLNSAIGKDVELVKAGVLSLEDARINLEKAAQAINIMEASQKRLGKENLRYWTDNGAEIEAQIIIQKETLTARRLELLQAAQQAAIQQARLNYGNI